LAGMSHLGPAFPHAEIYPPPEQRSASSGCLSQPRQQAGSVMTIGHEARSFVMIQRNSRTNRRLWRQERRGVGVVE
jgi:hypothetical protein